jgi:hypothetical protein
VYKRVIFKWKFKDYDQGKLPEGNSLDLKEYEYDPCQERNLKPNFIFIA